MEVGKTKRKTNTLIPGLSRRKAMDPPKASCLQCNKNSLSRPGLKSQEDADGRGSWVQSFPKRNYCVTDCNTARSSLPAFTVNASG